MTKIQIVMCIERKMKVHNNEKMVCNDMVREICTMIPNPTNMTNYELMVHCIERKMKVENNDKLVCNDIVRDLCTMLRYPTLLYLNELLMSSDVKLEEEVSFCEECGNFIDYTIYHNNDYPRSFECKCMMGHNY